MWSSSGWVEMTNATLLGVVVGAHVLDQRCAGGFEASIDDANDGLAAFGIGVAQRDRVATLALISDGQKVDLVHVWLPPAMSRQSGPRARDCDLDNIVDDRSDGKCDIDVVIRIMVSTTAPKMPASRAIRRDQEDTLGKVEVSNEELRTVRDAMRELNRMVDLLERGDSEKFVLTKHGQMRAVVLSVESFAELRQPSSDRGLQAAA
jgi:hypothetical protein